MILAYLLKLLSILKDIIEDPNTGSSSVHTEYALVHKSNNMSHTI